jgi:hypothetical protein
VLCIKFQINEVVMRVGGPPSVWAQLSSDKLTRKGCVRWLLSMYQLSQNGKAVLRPLLMDMPNEA